MVAEVWELEQQTSSAASRVTEQPYLGSALLTSHEEGPRKGGPNIACSSDPGRPPRLSGHPSHAVETTRSKVITLRYGTSAHCSMQKAVDLQDVLHL